MIIRHTETETHRHEKCKTDLQHKSPNFHLLNIILGYGEVHATKLFDSQLAMMLISCYKRHFPTISVISGNKTSQ